jgi:TolB-like protein
MELFAELKRRNVIRMAGLYLVVAWLVIQVMETLLPIFDTPGWVLRTLVVLLAVGFVPALLFAWIYELTPEGLKRDADVAPSQAVAGHTARRMDRLIFFGLLALAAVVLADRYWPQRSAEPMAPADAMPGQVSGDATTRHASESASPPAPSSVAVLPFVNMSSDPEQEFFSDGMTEELLNVLAKIPQLQVAARTSVFAFKGKGGDVREIGRALGVGHIVEGSVRRDGTDIRVTAQLIRVSDGFHVWSETYDRKLEGVFALQDDLARRVAEALQRSLGVVAAPAPRATIDPQAYDQYLKGRALLRARKDLSAAIAHFKAAVAQAPEFAAAWSSLALSHDVAYWYTDGATLDERLGFLVAARAAAQRAAALDPGAAAVVHMLGNAARAQFRYADAEQHYLQAMQIDPSYPDVREDYAEVLYHVGRFEDSRQAARELTELDPYFVVGWNRIADAETALGNRAGVEQAAQKLREIAPHLPGARFFVLDYALTRGDADAARTELAQIRSRWTDRLTELLEVVVPWSLNDPGVDDARARAALAEMPAGYTILYRIARGDVDAYNAEMDDGGPVAQAYYFAYLASSPTSGWAMLREPRVKDRLKRYRFPEYWREKGWPSGCLPLDSLDFECGTDMAAAR